MKMNQTNPGGKDTSERYMKGCEKFMREGKGSVIQGSYLQTRFSQKAPGMKGWVPAKKARGR